MGLIDINRFRGELPSVNPYQLSVEHAVHASNAQIDSAGIRPLHQPQYILPAAYPVTQTIFRMRDGTWLQWDKDVDAVRSFAANDAYGRVYYTGDSYPRVTDTTAAVTGGPYPGTSYRLGVPAPTVKPGAVVGGTGSGISETRFYVYTYVDGYGAEGPPSKASVELTVLPGQTVDLTFTAPPGAPYSIQQINIYRTNSVGTSSDFQYVDSIDPNVALTYTDSKLAVDLGEVLPSETWDEPPSDMIGLAQVSPGVLGGFHSNEVCYSEIGLPHAFPVAYRRSVDYDIVALAPIGRGHLILTTGQPYAVSGSNPAAFSITRVPKPYACVSKRSVVTFDGFAVYASIDGLIAADTSSATMVTEGVFTADDWRALNPETMLATRWHGLYIARYTRDDGTAGGFMIDPKDPASGVVWLDDIEIDAAYFDPADGELYVVASGLLAKWDASLPAHAHWVSAKRFSSQLMPMAVAQVDADDYPVILTVWRDDEEQARIEIGSSDPTRIPGAALGRAYACGVYSLYRVSRIRLASTMSELAQ